MARRPTLTILLVTDTEVARADFSSGGSPRLRGLWQDQRRHVSDTLTTAVELAASLGPKLGHRVVVLATEIWTQTVSLSAASASGLSDAELSGALAFEVESLSGIEGFGSRLAFRAIGGDSEQRSYWIAQLDAGQIDGIEQVIAARGSRLAGLASPIGLPAGALGQGDERRVEFWPGAVCLVGPHAPPLVNNTDPRGERWRRALSQWEAEHGPANVSRVLVAPAVGEPPQLESDTLAVTESLADAAVLERWMTAWAGQFGGAVSVPTLRPPRKPMSRQTRTAIALAGAAMALTLCVGHWTYVDRATQNAQSRIDSLESLAERVKNLEQQRAAAEKEQSELERQLAEVELDGREVARLTGSGGGQVTTLLSVLSQLQRDELLIETLTTDAQGASVSGIALRSDAATEMAEQMRASLEDCGWQVQPPTQQGQKQLAGGGPWSFTIALRDVQSVNQGAAGEAKTADRAMTTAGRVAKRPSRSQGYEP